MSPLDILNPSPCIGRSLGLGYDMNDPTIRPYRPDDEHEVIRLWLECDLVVPWNDPKRDIERKLAVDPEWFLIGETGGRIIATCMAGYEGHRGWINYLAVSPRYRRWGVATRLMRKAESLLEAAGCPKINIQIREGNEEVIRFYESIGYTSDPIMSMGKRLEEDEPNSADVDAASGSESPE